MRTRRGSSVFASLLVASAGFLGSSLSPEVACAYEMDVHYQLALRGLTGSGLETPASPQNLVVAGAVRSAIDTYARRSPTLHDAWVKRYPNPSDFDDWAFKYFLLLEPGARVYGIDRLDERIPPSARLLDIIAGGTRQPDDDWRNRERLAYSRERVALKDKKGNPVPADPALLNMGKLGSLSSQAHAHYGLAQVEFSDDPEVLKKDPRRFAKKADYERAPIITLAAEMAQQHLDLSLIAALSDAPGARELSWMYTGQGFHYLQDVGNQIHTVQVGLYQFFVDAGIERLKLGMLTGGGYLGQMRSLASIGIDILSNHHVLSEHLTQKRLLAAVSGGGDADGQRLLVAPSVDDPEFSAQLDTALKALGPTPERGEFAMVITRALIEASSHEGDAIYRTTRAIADPALRTRNGHYDETRDDPERSLVPRGSANEADYKEFFSLQERAFRRVGTAMRRWVALEQKALSVDKPDDRAFVRQVALERLIGRQLKALDVQEARLADYLQHPLEDHNEPERSPAILALDIFLLVLLDVPILYYVWRRRRRAQAAAAPSPSAA
jgi:hypothetical protein